MSRVLPKISGKNRAKQRFFAPFPCAGAKAAVWGTAPSVFLPGARPLYTYKVECSGSARRAPLPAPGRPCILRPKNIFTPFTEGKRKSARPPRRPSHPKRRIRLFVWRVQDAASPNILYGFRFIYTGYCAFYTIFKANFFRCGRIFLLLIFVEFVIIKL